MSPLIPMGMMKRKPQISEWWSDDDEMVYFSGNTLDGNDPSTAGWYIKIIIPAGWRISESISGISFTSGWDSSFILSDKKFFYKQIDGSGVIYYSSQWRHVIPSTLMPSEPPFSLSYSSSFVTNRRILIAGIPDLYVDGNHITAHQGGWFKYDFDNSIYRKALHGGDQSAGGVAAIYTGGSPQFSDQHATVWTTGNLARHIFSNENNPTLEYFALFGSSGEWFFSPDAVGKTPIDINLSSAYVSNQFPPEIGRVSGFGDNSGLYTVANGGPDATIIEQSNSGYIV